MLTRPAAPGQSPSDMTIWFDDRAVAARAGESIAVALLAAGNYSHPHHAGDRLPARAIPHDGGVL
jgi:hypothetical protein